MITMSYAKNIQEKKLKSGGTLLLSKFPAHERFSIVGSVKGGVRFAGSRALAEAHAAMLLEGTSRKSKAQIQVLLDDIGATLSFAAEKDRLVFSGHVRAVYAKKLLSLIAEALREPSFPARELATYKERMAAEFSIEAQETRMQAGINLSHLLYPPEHPNYQASTESVNADLAALTRSELKKYHQRAIDRSSLVVSIAGDIKPRELAALVETSFAKLPQARVEMKEFLPSSPKPAQTIAVHIDDKSSIDYMLGIATGITKDAPDYPALQLGIQVLGNRSGFTGRLMKTVREVEGLTYGVYSYLAGFLNADGFIVVWATFAPELYEKGKAALMREIRGIAEGGATEDEVRKHQTMFEARSRVTLSSSGDLARAAHDVAIEGRRMSYLDEFPQRILKLTTAEVNAALKKYLVPADLSESAAGPVPETK
jgi:zinc protease